jgi:chaperonin GroES
MDGPSWSQALEDGARPLATGGKASETPGRRAGIEQDRKGEREMAINVHPLSDRILVKRLEEEEMKRGGIIIPDTAKEKPQQGEVMAVGPGRYDENGKRIPMEVKKGDRILMGKYSGTEVKIDGGEYVILREDDVLGIIQSHK